jgi:hypothetical protein
VAIAFVASPATALRPCSCEGFVGLSFFLFLPLPSLTSRAPVFQAFRLLNNAIDEGVGVKNEATVMSGDEELHCKLCQLIRKTLQDGALIFPLCNLDARGS